MSNIPNALKAIKRRPDKRYTVEEKRIVAELIHNKEITGMAAGDYLGVHHTGPSLWHRQFFGKQKNKGNKSTMKTGKRHSRYSPHFKLKVVKRVTEGGEKISHVARDIGTSDSVIHGWKKNIERIIAQAHQTPKPSSQELALQAMPQQVNGHQRDESEALNFTKQKLRQLEDENETLLKTVEIYQRRLQAYRDRYGSI